MHNATYQNLQCQIVLVSSAEQISWQVLVTDDDKSLQTNTRLTLTRSLDGPHGQFKPKPSTPTLTLIYIMPITQEFPKTLTRHLTYCHAQLFAIGVQKYIDLGQFQHPFRKIRKFHIPARSAYDTCKSLCYKNTYI